MYGLDNKIVLYDVYFLIYFYFQKYCFTLTKGLQQSYVSTPVTNLLETSIQYFIKIEFKQILLGIFPKF